MKLRSFATLLVCAALAACEGDTLLPTQDLAGRWESARLGRVATLPEGDRPVVARVELTLRRNGEYHLEFRMFDPVRGIDFPDVVTEGTYTAGEGFINLTHLRAYYRAGRAPTTPVTLQPLEHAGTETYQYSVKGRQMGGGTGCGPLANCVVNPFALLTLVDPE